jgi:hypothetical protein
MIPRKVILDAIRRTYYYKSDVSQHLRSCSVSSRPTLCSQSSSTIISTENVTGSRVDYNNLSQTENDESKSSPSNIVLNFQKLITNENAHEIRQTDNDFTALWNDDKIEKDESLDSHISLSSDLFSDEKDQVDDESENNFNEEVITFPSQSPHTLVEERSEHQKGIQHQLPRAPNMTIYQYKSTEETFFQWDYRNHHNVIEWNMVNMLTKIDKTLKDAHLEPYGKQRGVDTVRNNVLSLDVTEKFRLGRHKSLQKGKLCCKVTRKGIIPDYDKTQKRMQQLLRPMYLMRSILKVIYERHAIYASGYTEQIAHLDPFCLGESFFGPDTKIRVDYDTARLMLRELWLHGHSSTFNKLQKNHNAQQERMKEKNYRPKLTD